MLIDGSICAGKSIFIVNLTPPRKMKLTFSLTILILCMGRCLSQKNFSITLHFPSQLEREKLTVWYDDGKDSYRKNPDSTNTMHISGPFYGRWVTVGVFYPDSSRPNYYFANNFCAMDQPAEITIRMDGHTQDPLQGVQLKKAWLLNDMGKGRFDAFAHNELKAYDDFIRMSMPRTDSVDSVAGVLGRRLVNKELEYIRQNPGEYYCIYVFRDWLSRTSYMEADTALRFFNTVFPDSLKQCFEGQESLKRLQARLAMKEGNKAPDYTTRDINGKIVHPADGKGKYVLLDFWASWCVPCVKSLPMLKQLQKDYGADKLKIISVSLDTHRDDFDRALKEHGMDWTQIYGDKELIKAYNIGPIPQVVLIGPDGNIAYIRLYTDGLGKLTGDGDYDRLKALLKERIR
jgi:thiol-disulfide isomerase/thioredoxin